MTEKFHLLVAAAPVLDYLENSLYKFDDGPFFLGQFSLVKALSLIFS